MERWNAGMPECRNAGMPECRNAGTPQRRNAGILKPGTQNYLRYHGRWVLTKNGKKLFFAVQIEKTEINILQKNGKKSFFTFQDRREKLFLNLINPRRCIDKFLSSLIKIHRQLSRQCNVNCGTCDFS